MIAILVVLLLQEYFFCIQFLSFYSLHYHSSSCNIGRGHSQQILRYPSLSLLGSFEVEDPRQYLPGKPQGIF